MKYILTSDKLSGKILLEFAYNGYIRSFELSNEDDVKEKLVRWLFARFPVRSEALKIRDFADNFHIDEVPEDTSFTAFWNHYNYKVGNKFRAERLWNALTNTDKSTAMAAIKRYNQYLVNHPRIERLYPETWLNQKRWDNKF